MDILCWTMPPKPLEVYQPRGKKALVIGNGDYSGRGDYKGDKDLACCISDSRNVTEALECLGFDVVNPVNCGGRTAIGVKTVPLQEAIGNWISTKVKSGDLVVVYFSGHGCAHHGYNLMAPVDPSDPLVSVEDVIRAFNMKSYRDLALVLMMDMCRADETDLTFKDVRAQSRRSSSTSLAPRDVRAKSGRSSSTSLAMSDVPELKCEYDLRIVYATCRGCGALSGHPVSIFTDKFIESLDETSDMATIMANVNTLLRGRPDVHLAPMYSNLLRKVVLGAPIVERPRYNNQLLNQTPLLKTPLLKLYAFDDDYDSVVDEDHGDLYHDPNKLSRALAQALFAMAELELD